MNKNTAPTAEELELEIIRNVLDELNAHPVLENEERMEEEIDISELPESEQNAILQRAEERDTRTAHLSPDERYQLLLKEAAALAHERGLISACTIQRYLYTGYAMAARIIDELQKLGLIRSAPKGFKVYTWVE